jgi:two-component system cell cycle sensor histidine kinase/response regulator CckA
MLTGVFIAYLATAELGLSIPFTAGSAASLWPSAAVSLAAVLLLGRGMWPAILVADLAASASRHYAVLPSLGIAIGNTIEPLVSAMLLRWFGDFRPSLKRLRYVVHLLLFGVLLGPAAAATFWILFRWVALGIPIADQFDAWFMWLRSDAIAILVITPFILVWSRSLRRSLQPKRLAEAVVSLTLLIIVTCLVFSLPLSSAIHSYAIEYLSFPFVIWIALRFGLNGATLAMVVTALIAVPNTVAGKGPFIPHGDPVLVLHIFLGVLTTTGLVIAATISEHRKAKADCESGQDQLRASEERYRDLFENAQDFIVTLDLEGRFTSANNAVLEISGFSRTELLSMTIFDIMSPSSLEPGRSAFQEVVSGQKRGTTQLELMCKDGRALWVEVRSRRIEQQGVTTSIQSIGRDISWRKRLEEQLLHAQKMEAVGRLAGGVAHDFNNLLGVIIGYSDLLLHQLGIGDPSRQRIQEIKKAGTRAAEVTRQLLAFSRKQVLAPKIVDLSSIVSDTAGMLLRLLGEDIELITKVSPVGARVKADPAQMEQVIMNLAVNARDAMPRGGKLILETSTAVLGEILHHEVPVAPGRYVLLAVADTGVGMSESTRARIFEPFFTTKQPGEGTGLGLATVYGFVKQTGGYIWVYSEPGKGTTFKIYLPQVTEPAHDIEPQQEPAALPHGSETVLLVEDAESLRELNHELLEGLGYTVLQAGYGAEALIVAGEHQGPIHILLTDVVMPGMSGRELAEQLALTRAETKVLYMSGYTDNVIIHHGILKAGIAFLQKPFTQESLAQKLREVLEPRNATEDLRA